MNLKEHKKDFNKRWNINSSDSFKVSFEKLKNRLINIFQNIDGISIDDHYIHGMCSIDKKVSKKSIYKFCQYYGISIPEKLNNGQRNIIIDCLKKEDNNIEFFRLIEVILSLKFWFEEPDNCKYYEDEDEDLEVDPVRTTIEAQICEEMKKNVKKAIEESNIVAMKQHLNGYIILYPKGEEKLDEELINKPLSFLNKESNEHFEKALKFYQNKNLRESADNLRRSLEESLRYKLGNTKGLKQNIQDLQKKLKENGNQSEIRNIIFQTFNYLDEYFNEHSKHGNSVNEPENEFLIYQTGLLMRYINKIDNFKKQKQEEIWLQQNKSNP